MALHRATQSAIWYYVSCTPCAEARYRKKLRNNAERWRLEREAMAAEDPDMYQHPSPSGINPNWQTEMDAGPHVVARGRKKTTASDTRRPRTSMTQLSNVSEGPSSLDLTSSAASRDGRNDSKFDFKQYQREDDRLWGSVSTERLTSNASEQSGTITKPQKARIRGGDYEMSYAKYRNPQISELHPATVTKISSREEARWMFQGLPNVDVMTGRDKASRSRSDSGNSSRTSAKSPVLSSTQSVSRGSSFRTPNFVQPPSRYPSNTKGTTDGKDSVQDSIETNDRETMRSLSIPSHIPENSEESSVTVIRSPDLAPQPLRKRNSRKAATKPELSTIVSDNTVPSGEHSFTNLDQPKENSDPGSTHNDTSISENSRTQRRSTGAPSTDDSLKVLRDLAPSSAIFNTTAVVSTDDLTKASKSTARNKSQASAGANSDFDPDVFESWDSAEFELPEWIHEHTKREVKERWSMDI